MRSDIKSLQDRVDLLEDQNIRFRNEIKQLRGMIDAPRNVMQFSFDREHRYITYNQAHYEFVKHNWGVTIYPGMTILDIFDNKTDRESAREHFDRVLQGESYILKREYKRRKGETKFYENTYVPILENGFITAGTVSAHDITQWSEKEKEGRKFRSIFDKALEGIFRSTAQGRFIEANREMARILGYESPEELIKSITDISSQLYCDPIERDTVMTILRDQEVVKDFETRMFRKDGTPIWVEFNARCEKNDLGQTLYIEGKLTDISTRKKTEQRRQQMMQAEKMASLGVLVAGVAHEINNPNSYLTLNLPLLKDVWNDAQEILDEYSDEYGDFVLGGLEYSELREQLPYLLNEMMEGATRIKDIVAQLKDYSRQDADDEREYIELNDIVRGALTFVRHKIKNSARHFELILPEISPVVEGNPQRLIQVLMNLIVNSCEALPEKDSQLSITVKTTKSGSDKNQFATITVVDNGCGIPDKNLRYIEDPFFTTKRDSGGTGLGLSISSNIMKKHNGYLEFKSPAEGGTRATIKLPLYS
ncbi:PAS domain-containing sensor histidine kinase [Maridesulfovibrio hydrothermalis]|uniref:histidine kinase n=1 Tax=Maridesulfovibrio hydrothermalis AM13 = DSM 14728 TaxID=1121451 RepID=L0RCE8_9BACT|nr:ATP-binding protein [Maridesulfovibrio hydrothermalis]CCO24404.1 PAS/PAC sensor signal transduction histidine kinase [Maridesulfovibrio hydrothermalis AM13 = DSM 14728]